MKIKVIILNVLLFIICILKVLHVYAVILYCYLHIKFIWSLFVIPNFHSKSFECLKISPNLCHRKYFFFYKQGTGTAALWCHFRQTTKKPWRSKPRNASKSWDSRKLIMLERVFPLKRWRGDHKIHLHL